jgi:hypothetical protein
MDTTSDFTLTPAGKPKTTLGLKARNALFEELMKSEKDLRRTDSFFRGAIFSGPGAGKTTFAARVGDPKKMTIILDAENSTEVIKQQPDLLARFDAGLLKAFPFPGIREATELLPAFEADPMIDTVVIDSFTSANSMEMRDILRDVKFSRGSAAPGEETSQQDYGLLLDRWTWLFDVAMMTSLNFILVCHERAPTREEILVGFKMRTVAGSPNQSKVITSRLGNVLYLTTGWDDKGNRTGTVYTRPITGLATKGFPDTYAKNRMNLPPKLSDVACLEAIAKWRTGA